MPRKAHGRSLYTSKPAKPERQKAKNRRLNALEIAEEENPEQIKVPQHRLGEVDDDPDDQHTRDDLDGRSTKRRKVDITGPEDSADEGSDFEGSRWHVGVENDEEDSDIDSDDAFGHSDEERFADFTFRGSTTVAAKSKNSGAARKSAVSENEENTDEGDEEEEDDLGDEAVDLATAWDMDDQVEEEEGANKRKRKAQASEDEDSESDDDDPYGSGEDSDPERSDLSVSEDEGDHSRLQSFVEGLTDNTSGKKPQSRQSLNNLSGKPSQFGLGVSKISAADMLQYITDPRQRQSIKILQNSEANGSEAYRGGIPGKLAPPLAKRQQDRLDRAAAYDETKKELSKWIETVKQNRRAEHLSFPLEDPGAVGMLNSKQLASTSQSQPMNSLESTIQSIMLESGLVSNDNSTPEQREQVYEELQEKKMPLEEVQARRAELRRARDLMFREEIRARRVKKIKSKAYRRVHRKERDKMMLEDRERLETQGLIDSDEERERNDRRRAEERMGARHRESKWAKSVKATGRAAWDDEARQGVNDLARRHDELRRRIEGKSGHNSEEDDSDSSESAAFSDSEAERDRLRRKLVALDDDQVDTTKSRLTSMAFMQKAEAARKAANDDEIRKAKSDLQSDNVQSFAGSDSDEQMGRQKFGSKINDEVPKEQTVAQKSEFEEPESENEQRVGSEALEDEETTERSRPMVLFKDQDRRKKSQSSKFTGKPKQALEQTVDPLTRAKPTRAVKMMPTVVAEAQLDDYTSASDSEPEENNKVALAQDIFAGPDEVIEDFEKEKKETMLDEGDQVVDNGLPGWGSWTGEGVSKKAQKRAQGKFLTTIKGVAHDKRKDARLDRVIINERRVKKNDKYLASELPHPFESRQQYERSLRLPLGPEWTTKSTFQDATKPRVLMKQGVIRPMARPLA